jgi:hypothetical protein
LKGDSNNTYFHGIANNRKKKCTIFSLEDGEREIRDTSEIRNHVENFYKNLFGPEPDGSISLGEDFWREEGRLSEEEAQELIRPFSLTELEGALKDMDVNSAPGPDGLPVSFYLVFWQNIKYLILEMFNEFHRGGLDLSRINYGMISLIPKLKEANNIKQFRPICLLNVDYKWFTKVLTMRLTPYAGKIISETRTLQFPKLQIYPSTYIKVFQAGPCFYVLNPELFSFHVQQPTLDLLHVRPPSFTHNYV